LRRPSGGSIIAHMGLAPRVSAAVAAAVSVVGLAWAGPSRAGVVELHAGVLSYRAGPGELNNAEVTLSPRPTPSVAVLHDEPPDGLESPTPPVPLVAGAGCTAADASEDPYEPRYPFARCAFEPLQLPRLDVALGDDHDRGSFPRQLGGRVAGGAGDDDLQGAGLLLGGHGDDLLHAIGSGARLLGGPGRDEVRVAERADGVRASGGPGNDLLNAESAVRGVVLDGGLGNDGLLGGEGADVLRGGPGNDYFEDVSVRGNVMELGSGRDTVTGGEGPDLIRARDGQYDEISCFGGRDTLVLDALDFYETECERVRRRGLARSIPLNATAYFTEIEDVAYANSLGLELTCPFDGRHPCEAQVVVSDRGGVVLRRSMRERELGRAYPDYRLPRGVLRRLVEWARITIVSRDRRGGLHRHSIAGAGIVRVAQPD
jgi:RTX calcium-binding nonapeptide repeat (4 copies)